MTIQLKWVGYSVLANLVLAVGAHPPLAQASVETERLNPIIPGQAEVNSQPAIPTAQAATAIITDVQVSETPEGLSIVLISDQPLSVGDSQISGNALITTIPNAALELADAETAEQFAPAEGIALVQVSSLPNGAVQVAITGADAPPVAQVSTASGRLVLCVVPGLVTANTDDSDALQVVVTATRTEENILEVPRSVTVIEREQIEQQLAFTNNLPDILGRLVPGLSPPTLQTTTRGLTLRGRNVQVLVDGVPQTVNSGSGFELNGIAPEQIERIEVIPGASAIYGDGAAGGVINIITRAPIDSGVVYDISVGTQLGLTSIEGDSFSYDFRLGVAAAEENVDGRFTLTYEEKNARFDANGNRIPPETGISDDDRVSLLAKLGYDLDEAQRLAFTYSFYQESLDTVFATDTSIFAIPGTQTARAVEIGNVNYNAPPRLTNHILNLTYRHTALLGSQLDTQLYYRNLETVSGFSDLRPLGFPFPLFPSIFQSRDQISEWGARVQIDTPLGDAANVVWGADYSQESNEIAALFLDPAAFDANQQLNIVDEFSLFPRYELNSLGLFAQAQWDITDQWQISGGVRYENFDFSVGDYQLAFALAAPRDRRGGSGSANDVSFNAGVLYRPIPEVGLFANFSQGFSIPNLGSVFSAADTTFDISNDLALTPQEVNNFEIGARAEFEQVQASIAGFYSESDLGSAVLFNPATVFSELVRAPQRNYGLEAAVDWQPSDVWRLGSYFSWSEGENDIDNDGQFLALGSLNVPPYKLGLYVENETTPGWTNRLQMLLVGDRDRAFNDGVDLFEINSYVTLDWLSSLQLGQGQLTLGVENLLNTEYLPLTSQERIGGFEERRYAAPGTTLSIRYSLEF